MVAVNPPSEEVRLAWMALTLTPGMGPTRIRKAMERLRQTTPITVLLGEQNVTFALPHADRVYVLEHGRIVWEGDPSRFEAEVGERYL